MTEHGYGGPEVKIQQLKMQLRSIINAILDQKIHTAGMTEREAMNLMMNDGFQEEGEAAGKWRRAALTSTQSVDLLCRLQRGCRYPQCLRCRTRRNHGLARIPR